MVKSVLRIVLILFVLYAAFGALIYFRQGSLLYIPSHADPSTSLTPWWVSDCLIGYCRETPNPRTIWLMLHGNAGQAADRDYVLPRMSADDALYVLEYPGYGARGGSPGLQSINQAAAEAYRFLRSRHPNIAICVLGESIGSGPACALARESIPPDKIVLVAPFDTLANVAARQFPFLPVRLMLRDAWDNVESLRHYSGPVEIFGAMDDHIIPIAHAKALAHQVGTAQLVTIQGGHNDWPDNDQVKIQR